jgi:hypothetical protein
MRGFSFFLVPLKPYDTGRTVQDTMYHVICTMYHVIWTIQFVAFWFFHGLNLAFWFFHGLRLALFISTLVHITWYRQCGNRHFSEIGTSHRLYYTDNLIIVASMPAWHFLRVRARSFRTRIERIRHAGIPGFLWTTSFGGGYGMWCV